MKRANGLDTVYLEGIALLSNEAFSEINETDDPQPEPRMDDQLDDSPGIYTRAHPDRAGGRQSTQIGRAGR